MYKTMRKTKKEKKELSPVEQLRRRIEKQMEHADRESAAEHERHTKAMHAITKRMDTYREQLKALK